MTAPAVYGAINAVKLVLAKEGVAKGRQTSAQGRYQYRGVDDIIDACALPMAEAGLCVFQRTVSHRIEEHKSNQGATLFYCYVECEFDFVATDDGSMHTARFVGESFDSGDKSTGKAETYAFRNCLAKTFVIPVNGAEADSDKHESPPVQPRERQPPPAAPRPQAAPPSQQPPSRGYYDRVWPLFSNSSVVGKPLSEVPTEKLTSYIARLEKSLKDKDEEIRVSAQYYYKAALAEFDRRDKSEAPKSGAASA